MYLWCKALTEWGKNVVNPPSGVPLSFRRIYWKHGFDADLQGSQTARTYLYELTLHIKDAEKDVKLHVIFRVTAENMFS